MSQLSVGRIRKLILNCLNFKLIVFQNPKILILDEATSALDAYSEYLVDKALKEISRDRTVLTIAHRLSTIQSADEVAVLENGVILEQGPYNELMSKPEGFFRELITHQSFSSKKREQSQPTIPDESTRKVYETY